MEYRSDKPPDTLLPLDWARFSQISTIVQPNMRTEFEKPVADVVNDLELQELSTDSSCVLYASGAPQGESRILPKQTNSGESSTDILTDRLPCQMQLDCWLQLCLRCSESQTLEDLNIAIAYGTYVLQSMPGDSSDICGCLAQLSILHLARAGLLDGVEDITLTVTYNKLTMSMIGPDHEHRHECLDILGRAHLMLFERLGRLEDLTEAVHYQEKAVGLSPEDNPRAHNYLNHLGVIYKHLFTCLGSLEDLEKAVVCMEQAMHLAPHSHISRSACLNNLGDLYKTMSDRFGSLEYLNKAITHEYEAVQLTPDSHPNAFIFLDNLGNAYEKRFDYLGTWEDLEKAVSYKQQAVQLAPQGHPDMPRCLSNLGNSYKTSFDHLGRLKDLDEAVSCMEQAVLLTPVGHHLRASHLNNLGSAYGTLFERLGGLRNLEKAVDCEEEAVQSTPDSHPDKPSWLVSLGNACMRRFHCLGRPEDLEKTIRCMECALPLMPRNHPRWITCLHNLSNAYKSRFEHSQKIEDLHVMIKNQLQVVQLTPDDHPNQAASSCSLARAYMRLFLHSDNLVDLKTSITNHEKAVKHLAPGHASESNFRCYLAQAYAIRYCRWPSADDARQAWGMFRQASLFSVGSPTDRLDASSRWALMCELLRVSPIDAYRNAFALLPQVVWLGTSVQSRYDSLIRDVGDLVNRAVAAATSRQLYQLAVEWIEQGRSMVWTQTLGLRTPLDSLQTVHPNVASKLKDLSASLAKMSMYFLDDRDISGDAARMHRRLAEEHEGLLDHIHRLPGFEDFLRALSFDKLVGMLNFGVTVIVHVQETGADALVIDKCSRKVNCITLDGFSRQKVSHTHDLLSVCLRVRGTSRGIIWGDQSSTTFHNVLAVLWSNIVAPILGHLNITQSYPDAADALPHITWCTTGILSFLPLHAAGDYTDSTKVLHNLAISSYAPSISLLRHTSDPNTFSGILAIGQELPVRNCGALPGAGVELDQIQRQCHAAGVPFTRLNNDSAYTSAVLEAMSTHSWVHFACHASQNLHNPMQSALHLHDTDLDLATIAQHDLKNVQLAFLSACQTATGYTILPDESVHLAAGLMMAGYPTVIATMWSIVDQDAPLVASKMYEYMLADGVPDSRKAAKALHRAVAHLRDKIGLDQYGRWMPYIHMGR